MSLMIFQPMIFFSFSKIINKFYCFLTNDTIPFINEYFSQVFIHIPAINKKYNHPVFQLNMVQPIDSGSIIAYFYF
jgi:hypothetical protein